MLKTTLLALALALVGAIFLPMIAFFGSLSLFYIIFPQCGQPSDSGGCEMSAGMIGFAAIIPGVLIGVVAGVYLGRGRTPSSVLQAYGVSQPQTDVPTIEGDARLDSRGLLGGLPVNVTRWATDISNIQRVWLFGACVRGSYMVGSQVDLAIEIYGWDSPDPRDRQQAHVTWHYKATQWQEMLSAKTTLPIKLWPLSADGGDGALRTPVSGSLLVFERRS